MLIIYYQEWDKLVCIIYKNKIWGKQTTILFKKIKVEKMDFQTSAPKNN
jgi:hypothetical protein